MLRDYAKDLWFWEVLQMNRCAIGRCRYLSLSLYIYSYAKFVEAFQIECIIVGINIGRRDNFDRNLRPL